jgi:hypothetical protein
MIMANTIKCTPTNDDATGQTNANVRGTFCCKDRAFTETTKRQAHEFKKELCTFAVELSCLIKVSVLCLMAGRNLDSYSGGMEDFRKQVASCLKFTMSGKSDNERNKVNQLACMMTTRIRLTYTGIEWSELIPESG